MRNFKDLTIWQRSFTLVKEVYLLSTYLPSEERYGLKSQIKRAAVSIPSNIAEGCGRNSDIELIRYLNIAIGSAFELETQLMLINELFDTPDTDKMLGELNSIQKMITGYCKYLKSNNLKS